MKAKHPKRISLAITSTLEGLGLGAKVRQYEVLDVWPMIVGESIAHVATAERIVDGKLFVSVTRSTWRNELLFLKKELIGRINTAMQQEIVKDIIFR